MDAMDILFQCLENCEVWMGHHRLWLNQARLLWLWKFGSFSLRDFPPLVLNGIALSEKNLICVCVWVSSWTHGSCWKSWWQLWLWGPLHMFECYIGPGVPAHCHSCSCDFPSGFLQHSLTAVALQQDLEASTGAKCINIGSKWCYLLSTCNNTTPWTAFIASVHLMQLRVLVVAFKGLYNLGLGHPVFFHLFPSTQSDTAGWACSGPFSQGMLAGSHTNWVSERVSEWMNKWMNEQTLHYAITDYIPITFSLDYWISHFLHWTMH